MKIPAKLHVLSATAFLLFGLTALSSCDQKNGIHSGGQYANEKDYAVKADESTQYEMPPPPPLDPTATTIEKGHADSLENRETYNRIIENPFVSPLSEPLSTFSIDVDKAAYSNVRRYLTQGLMPPADAVRTEEMVNYFDYDYKAPESNDPFAIYTEMTDCPWNPQRRLVMITLKGKEMKRSEAQGSNLVFLIDVSGSMEDPAKLPLLQQSLVMLTRELTARDRVSLVVYAGAAGVVLPPTPGDQKQKITQAINKLTAGGSTAGGAGIELAYKLAGESFVQGGNNRVILATDGDFNVGAQSQADLEKLIEEKRKSGIFLTVLGFGTGNYNDAAMQVLADKGNGNHFYIDTEKEAQKVLVREITGTLFTIAKDVKIQIEFNPAKVKGYRLVGYENRMLAAEDFDNDLKDAGELGAGHTVTALYEIIPAGSSEKVPQPAALKYQQTQPDPVAFNSGELMTVKFRYKAPDGETSKLIVKAQPDSQVKFEQASENLRWAAAVTEFTLLLRNSEYKGIASYDHVGQTAMAAKGNDVFGYRAEFLELVQKAKQVSAEVSARGK